ncbi:MAG: hypothetical protein RLZZ605_1455 [Bacteroidota bacterium]|jgi:hypothetical protein
MNTTELEHKIKAIFFQDNISLKDVKKANKLLAEYKTLTNHVEDSSNPIIE